MGGSEDATFQGQFLIFNFLNNYELFRKKTFLEHNLIGQYWQGGCCKTESTYAKMCKKL